MPTISRYALAVAEVAYLEESLHMLVGGFISHTG